MEIYLDFDPVFLEVEDSESSSSGVQIEPDKSSLDTVLANSVDNSQGQITYSVGKLIAPYPTGAFKVATIHFIGKKATTESIPTEITFSLESPRVSKVDYGGDLITGQAVNASVDIVQSTVTGKLTLQGGSRPDAGWQVPAVVKFFAINSDPLVDTPVKTYSLTTQIGETDSQSGKPVNATFTITSAPIGEYDITVDSPHTLMNIKRNVTTSPGQMTVDFGQLLEGDANDDGKINISDFGILASAFGKSTNQSGYDSRADFDRNGAVNISDFGLLAVNYAQNAPIDAP